MSIFIIGDETETWRHGPRSHRTKGSWDVNIRIWLQNPLLYCLPNNGHDKCNCMMITPIWSWKCDFGVLNYLAMNHISFLQDRDSSVWLLDISNPNISMTYARFTAIPTPSQIPSTLLLSTAPFQHFPRSTLWNINVPQDDWTVS